MGSRGSERFACRQVNQDVLKWTKLQLGVRYEISTSYPKNIKGTTTYGTLPIFSPLFHHHHNSSIALFIV